MFCCVSKIKLDFKHYKTRSVFLKKGEVMNNFVKPRPIFPKRAVITGGMPNGGKHLTFAHVGLMLRTDTFARFMRDRIGAENVIFVSGTDCYGSPPMEKYRKFKAAGEIDPNISLADFSERFYREHAEVFKNAKVSFNLYGASAFDDTKLMHEQVSNEILKSLIDAGMVEKQSSYAFYDKKMNVVLNGRQVEGKCPIPNCQGEHGYAETCDLGHQYLPQDLIEPISTLSNTKPELIKVENLYFKLDECVDILNEWLATIEKKSDTPSFMVKDLREFLRKPEIYIKRDLKEQVLALNLPAYELVGKETAPNITMVFNKLNDREKACDILAEHGIRYRTGKTLTPFRLTGNLEWGVPCPNILGVKGATFYVWPESLWAPISFTRTYLKNKGFSDDEWKKYWCSDDADVYQFMGEDNLYFYGLAQQAMWLFTQGKNPVLNVTNDNLRPTKLVPIKTLLLQGMKAGSSGSVRAPLADEILQFYTSDQYRMHFLGMNLGNNSVPFFPKPFNPDAKPEDADPVLKEGNLLTNVYNRILRTLFYTSQKELDGEIPLLQVDENIKNECEKVVLDYERLMYNKKFHLVVNLVDVFVRNINKYWAKNYNEAKTKEDKQRLIANTLQYVVTANILLHPMAPDGTEKVAQYLGLDLVKAFSWDYVFDEYKNLLINQTNPKFTFLKEREDFFKKLESQFHA